MALSKNHKGMLAQAHSNLKQAMGHVKSVMDGTRGKSDDDKVVKEASTFAAGDLALILQCELQEQFGDPEATDGSGYVSVLDMFDDYVVFRKGYSWQASAECQRCDYKVSDNGDVTFSTPIEVVRKVTYVTPADEKNEPPELAESGTEITGETIKLVETAVKADGTMKIKLIQPGWGSSGYYPEDVLKRDGPSIFKSGTPMYINHQTAQEEAARPEGDINAKLGVLTEDAKFEHDPIHGKGLYARTKVYKQHASFVNEVASDSGFSIRAYGKAKHGTAENKTGPIIQTLERAKSVDLVTVAGAGGKAVELFEAARNGSHTIEVKEDDMSAEELKRLTESNATLSQQITALRENQRRNDATQIAGKLIADKLRNYPVPAKDHALKEAMRSIPTVNDEIDAPAFETKINEAITSTVKLVNSVRGVTGNVQGLGSAGAGNDDSNDLTKLNTELAEAIKW
jgi:hypothetical protein